MASRTPHVDSDRRFKTRDGDRPGGGKPRAGVLVAARVVKHPSRPQTAGPLSPPGGAPAVPPAWKYSLSPSQSQAPTLAALPPAPPDAGAQIPSETPPQCVGMCPGVRGCAPPRRPVRGAQPRRTVGTPPTKPPARAPPLRTMLAPQIAERAPDGRGGRRAASSGSSPRSALDAASLLSAREQTSSFTWTSLKTLSSTRQRLPEKAGLLSGGA